VTTIAAAMAREANGFGLLRLSLAVAVVVSHGASAKSGMVTDEPLYASTGFTLGEHAVNGFFAVSGFLVAMSADRRGTRDYLLARALRIVPGFVAATLIVTFVLGTALTRLPVGAYLADPGTWRFAWNTLTAFKTNAALPGLFEANALRIPMGTVWTLKYEVLCYAGLLAAGLAGLLRVGWAAAGLPAGLFAALVGIGLAAPEASKGVETALRLPFLFATGAALYVHRVRVPLSIGIAIGLAAAAFLASGGAAYRPLLFLAEAYGVVWLALAPPWRPALDPRHDLSYGIYLYGWPVQQALQALWPNLAPAPALALALAVTAAVAALSWFLVERPALALKARAIRPPVLPSGPEPA
jgi:peptidoglycan/LPS O-acetylase OafA/YrhL